MTKWITKIKDFTFPTGSSHQNELQNLLAKEGQDGWEPWHANGWYNDGTETIRVWFKRPEE